MTKGLTRGPLNRVKALRPLGHSDLLALVAIIPDRFQDPPYRALILSPNAQYVISIAMHPMDRP